jgi:hypothetical protein
MPCIWGTHNRSQLFLDVGIIDAATLTGNVPGPNTVIQVPTRFKALVDTGAQTTMISPNVANTLGLVPIGQLPVKGVGPTVTYHNAYLFHVSFVIPMVRIGQAIPVPGVNAMIFILPVPIHGGEITRRVAFLTCCLAWM